MAKESFVRVEDHSAEFLEDLDRGAKRTMLRCLRAGVSFAMATGPELTGATTAAVEVKTKNEVDRVTGMLGIFKKMREASKALWYEFGTRRTLQPNKNYKREWALTRHQRRTGAGTGMKQPPRPWLNLAMRVVDQLWKADFPATYARLVNKYNRMKGRG